MFQSIGAIFVHIFVFLIALKEVSTRKLLLLQIKETNIVKSKFKNNGWMFIVYRRRLRLRAFGPDHLKRLILPRGPVHRLRCPSAARPSFHVLPTVPHVPISIHYTQHLIHHWRRPHWSALLRLRRRRTSWAARRGARSLTDRTKRSRRGRKRFLVVFDVAQSGLRHGRWDWRCVLFLGRWRCHIDVGCGGGGGTGPRRTDGNCGGGPETDGFLAGFFGGFVFGWGGLAVTPGLAAGHAGCGHDNVAYRCGGGRFV